MQKQLAFLYYASMVSHLIKLLNLLLSLFVYNKDINNKAQRGTPCLLSLLNNVELE